MTQAVDDYAEIKNKAIKYLMSVVLDDCINFSLRVEAAKAVLKYCKPEKADDNNSD